MIDKATAIAKARYAGRALGLFGSATMERQNGSKCFDYHSPSGKKYTIDVTEELGICDCPEYRTNLHLLGAAGKGKRVYRNPGPVCKHILWARAIEEELDLQAIVDGLPGELKIEALKAQTAEVQRLLS